VKASIVASLVTMEVAFTQRELELVYMLLGKLTGAKAEEIAGVPESGAAYTEILAGLFAAARPHVRTVETRGGDDRGNPFETITPSVRWKT
jgi:hypothetical protein